MSRSVTEREMIRRNDKVVAIVVHVSFHPVPSLARASVDAERMKMKVRACLGLFQRFQTLKRIRQPRPPRAADADIDADGQTNERIRFRIIHRRHRSSPTVVLGAPRTRTSSATDPPARDREPPIAYHAIRPSRPPEVNASYRRTRAAKRYVIHRTVHACAHRRRRSRRVVVHTYPLFLHKTCVVERRTRRWNART